MGEGYPPPDVRYQRPNPHEFTQIPFRLILTRMAGFKILIVGAGLGGLALAGFLDDCGIEYSIIEKCPEWCHEGYALGLWNNGRHILRKLGLSHWVDETEIAFQSVVICNGKGKKLRTYNLAHFYSEFGIAYSHVRRADLHQWLLGRIARPVQMGTSLTGLEEKEDGVECLVIRWHDSNALIWWWEPTASTPLFAIAVSKGMWNRIPTGAHGTHG